MAPLTWRNVDSPSFASANELYTLAAELMNRGFNAASSGLDKFREITTDEQSARLMQDVIAAGNDPAAIQAAATRGNAAFLSPEALRFANAQPGVLLDRQQAQANIAQTGVRTNALQYGLDRAQVLAGREDSKYEAQQAAAPILYDAVGRARSGDLTGSQDSIEQNAALMAAAGYDPSTIYNSLSGGFTGGISDVQTGVRHDDFMRNASNARTARELIDLAGRAFYTEDEARRGIQDLQAQGLISADLAQTALGSLGQAGLWTAPTAADEIMQRYGAAPVNGRGSTNPTWATGNNPVLNGFMSTIQRGGVTNPYALAAIQATGQHESGFDPGNAGRTWNDPSESGRPGTAGGIMSWNNDRLAALQRFTGGDLSPEAQAAFFLQEDPQLIARLNNAGSVEEAVALMNNAWRFAGYNRAGGEAEARLNTARSIYSGTPLSFGSNVPRAGTQPGASVYDQMMAAAVQDPNRTPLTFGEGTWTPEGGLQTRVTDDSPVSSIMAAASADPAASETAGRTTPLVASPQAADDGGARASQMMAKVLAQPVEDVKPAQIVEAGTAGDNPLFTEVSGGVVARPPMSQQEAQLISRAARAGILQTTPERATQQAEIDRVTQMMAEASDIVPNSNRSFFQPGAILGDIGMMTAQTGEFPFQLLSEYALGHEYTGETGRVGWNTMLRNSRISGVTNRIADDIATGRYGPAGSPMARGVGGLLDYFSASKEDAARNSADRQAAALAIEWWRSPEARSYFGQNPDELQTAAQNPVLFAQQRTRQAPETQPSQQGGQQGGQQTPARNQGEGQTPAATPTRRDVVKADELASLLRTAANTGKADQAYDLHAALDRAVVEGDNGQTNLGEMASRLRTEEGGMADYSHQDIEGALSKIMSELGVSLPVAAELLGNTQKYDGSIFNWNNWGSDLNFDMDDVRDRWRLYDQGNTTTAARIQAAVGRLNNRDRSQSAVKGIAQVQADYEVLVTAMNEQINRAPNQAQKDAIRERFERNVFPLLYQRVETISATGALTTYSGTRTDP